MCGLIRATTSDDLGASRRDRLRDLNQVDLLGVGERARLPRGAGDDNAVGTRTDHIVNVLLYVRPTHFTVCGERRDERNKDLAEGIFNSHPSRLPLLRPLVLVTQESVTKIGR